MCMLFCLRQKLPKVNKELALKLMEENDDEAELASRKKRGKVGKYDLHSLCVNVCVSFIVKILSSNVFSVWHLHIRLDDD